MLAPTLLLAAVLAHLPSVGLHIAPRGALPWVTATALGARLHRDLGVVPEAALGFHSGRPLVLAVVPMQAPWTLAVAGPGAPGPAGAAGTPGNPQAEVRTALAFFKMAAAARRAGIVLQINSGFRTNKKQREVYALYLRGRGPLAARPGSSNHQSGHALDLDTRLPQVHRWLQRHAFRYGFRRTIASERWHYEHWDIADPELSGSLRP